MTRIILLIFFIFDASILFSSETESFHTKENLFIMELYRDGRYFDCIAEARKLQNSKNTPSVEYFIYTNYYLAGQYSTVLNNYKADISTVDTGFRSSLLLSGSYLNSGMYYDSYLILKKYEYNELPEKLIFPMFLNRIKPLLISGKFDKIEAEIESSAVFLKQQNNYFKLRDELQRYSREGLKSPTLSAIMSAIVPGLGQCYSGYPYDGFISLLVVAATAAGGYYIRNTEYKGFSIPLFFFSGLFYTGNIYGAYNSAESANANTLRAKYNSINTDYGSYNPEDYADTGRIFD